ncbi:MAG TPA: phosphoribosyl-AMP cyclohydrolase [Bauldia sp.]|nr:phosphoribosyl-AMP cyclohydrolase [Bauldia sp.]
MTATFALRADEHTIETGTTLSPKFDADGLIVTIAVDADTGDVLMVAHMNAEALARTIETRQGWFFSRSRKRLWRKGEESGNTLSVADIRVDCDQDAVLLKVRVAGDGVACHTGYRSCFYRSIPTGKAPSPDLALVFDGTMPKKGHG